MRQYGEPQGIARHPLRIRPALVGHLAEGGKERFAAQRRREPHGDECLSARRIAPSVHCAGLNRPHIPRIEQLLLALRPEADRPTLNLKTLLLSRMEVRGGDERALTQMKIELAELPGRRFGRMPPNKPLP